MNTQAVNTSSRRKYSLLYLGGLGLTYVGACLSFLIGGPTKAEGRIAWAWVLGSLAWLVCLVPQLLVQWLILKGTRRYFKGSLVRCWIISTSIFVIAIGSILAHRYVVTRPGHTFERLLTKPIPESVRIVAQGRFLAMDSELIVLCFQISKSDFDKLVAVGNFSPPRENVDLARWQRRIGDMTGLAVNLSPELPRYTSISGTVEKWLFHDTRGNVVFVLDHH